MWPEKSGYKISEYRYSATTATTRMTTTCPPGTYSGPAPQWGHFLVLVINRCRQASNRRYVRRFWSLYSSLTRSIEGRSFGFCVEEGCRTGIFYFQSGFQFRRRAEFSPVHESLVLRVQRSLMWAEHGMARSDAAIPAFLICIRRLSDEIGRPDEPKHWATE